MAYYDEILKNTILTISKIYLVYAILLIVLFLIILVIKKFNIIKVDTKKAVYSFIGILICIVASYLILVIPRIADLTKNEYIQVENATLLIAETNAIHKGSGSIMFFGYADILSQNSRSIKVLGVNFFDLTNENIDSSYSYDIVYAKYSRQLITMHSHQSANQS